MPRRCTICHHPEHREIAISLFRDGTRATARRFQVSLPALDRHKSHLPVTLVKAEQAELLGELSGELQQAGAVHLHNHAHLHGASVVPTSAPELELEIARRVGEATD